MGTELCRMFEHLKFSHPSRPNIHALLTIVPEDYLLPRQKIVHFVNKNRESVNASSSNTYVDLLGTVIPTCSLRERYRPMNESFPGIQLYGCYITG